MTTFQQRAAAANPYIRAAIKINWPVVWMVISAFLSMLIPIILAADHHAQRIASRVEMDPKSDEEGYPAALVEAIEDGIIHGED